MPGGPRHIIGADTIYDQEYIRHYTGVRPILLGTTMVDALRSTNHATRRTKSSDRIACYADYTTEPLSISSICCGQSGKHNRKDLDRSKSCPNWRRQCRGYTANVRMGVCVATNADSKYTANEARGSGGRGEGYEWIIDADAYAKAEGMGVCRSNSIDGLRGGAQNVRRRTPQVRRRGRRQPPSAGRGCSDRRARHK